MPCLTLDLRIAGGELLVNLDGRHYSGVCESRPAISLLYLCLCRSVFPRVTSRVGLFKRGRPAYQATEKKRVPHWNATKLTQNSVKITEDSPAKMIAPSRSMFCFYPERFSCDFDWKQRQRLRATRGRWKLPRVPASHQKHLLEGKKKLQEQLKRNVLLMALNKKKKKKKNRLGKDFCLLIGPVAVATRWHHVIINRCLIRLAAHGKVLIKVHRVSIHTGAGWRVAASYGLLSMFTRWQADGRQAARYPAGSESGGQRAGRKWCWPL